MREGKAIIAWNVVGSPTVLICMDEQWAAEGDTALLGDLLGRWVRQLVNRDNDKPFTSGVSGTP
jgi:hypothetical protein